MRDNLSRRKLLLGTGIGITTSLAGCSALNGSGGSSSNSNGQSQESSGNYDYPTEPSQSEYVQNGQLKYPPSVQAFRIDELQSDVATVEMSIMPNPIADYEISVHLTPIDEVKSNWEYRIPASFWYGGEPKYDSESGRWVGKDVESRSFLYKAPEEHGEEVARITVPSAAAGTASEEVPPLPDGLTQEDVRRRPSRGEKLELFKQWHKHRKGIGDRYDDQWFGGPLSRPEGYEMKVGARFFDTTKDALPFLVDIEFSDEVPTYQPFVLTFQRHDSNSPDGANIAAFTEQFIRTSDGFERPSVLVDGEKNNALKNQDFHEYYGNGKKAAFENHVNKVETDRTSSDVGRVIRKELSYYRLSSYGVYSPTIEEIARKSRQAGDSSASAEALTPTAPANYSDSPVQNMWGVDLEITNEQSYQAQQVVEGLKENADHELLAIPRSERVRQHEIVQDLASQLKQICDRMGATTPAEQVRVVADFVQYMAHIQSGEPLSEDPMVLARNIPDKYKPPGGHHPVWTLYNGVGDCEDYTALLNTLLRTEQFGFETSAAAFEDVSILASPESGVGHVSTAIPTSQLNLDIPQDANYGGNSEGEVSYYEPCTFTHNGTEYAYVEASTVTPVGMIIKDPRFELPPLHISEYDYYKEN